MRERMSPGARRATFWVMWLDAGARQIGHLGSLVARSHAVRQRRQNPCLQAAAAPGPGTLGHVMSLSQGPRQIEHSLCGIRLAARWIVAAASSCMANLPLAARWIVAAASSCMANLPTLPRSKPSTGVAWRGKIVLWHGTGGNDEFCLVLFFCDRFDVPGLGASEWSCVVPSIFSRMCPLALSNE
ncbi:hypothetical protein EMIHUDRAFT_453282 [Emiliania huxleyi CCMP1516]|uniref:Uncharacterized protein n=2 Tax=Emiliania huxleyi TaxID=2903 RepID=A0A0D3I8X1_EMIH1|nr:hypothetical protein EMIHUDRAFT_453282 [Emiliania huxleyi CCMP1516]EOD07706.1 hypothetical protein EMIHUDRAFT_453282 [Emiliania huxleyi CCMP1516]|eukprot:XP_005760135.1 hypothetical protein EMIHUDRAFT_453282 [Emiliania huxleyi CCMP1516]